MSSNHANARGVRVKPLEWRTHPSYFGWRAESIIGAYRVDAETRCWRLIGVSKSASFTSSDEAKAAAQADYERRILSALATPPAPAPDVGEDALSEILSRFPDSTEVVVLTDPEHGDVEALDLTVGALTVMYARSEAYRAAPSPTPQPPAIEECEHAWIDTSADGTPDLRCIKCSASCLGDRT